MNQDRFSILQKLLHTKYKLILEGDRLIILGVRGEPLVSRYNTNGVKCYTLVYANKSRQYTCDELYCVAKGINVVGVRIKHNCVIRPKKEVLCNVCQLTYPEAEMRGSACYLCAHERKGRFI